MSLTSVVGRLSISDCQWSPSSNETYTPLSVPANRRPRGFGSARTTCTDAALGAGDRHVAPRLPVVTRYLDDAVGGTGPDHAGGDGRCGDGPESPGRHGRIAGGLVDSGECGSSRMRDGKI